MGYRDFHQHRYKVIRLSESGQQVSSEVVTGSKLAFTKQQELEVQGLKVEIWNITKGVKEYPLDDDDNDSE